MAWGPLRAAGGGATSFFSLSGGSFGALLVAHLRLRDAAQLRATCQEARKVVHACSAAVRVEVGRVPGPAERRAVAECLVLIANEGNAESPNSWGATLRVLEKTRHPLVVHRVCSAFYSNLGTMQRVRGIEGGDALGDGTYQFVACFQEASQRAGYTGSIVRCGWGSMLQRVRSTHPLCA